MKIITLFLSTILFCGITYSEEYTEVYCPLCHKHLYRLKYEGKLLLDDLKVENFESISGDEIMPDNRFLCPIDDAPLNGWEYWAWKRDMNQPKMVYPALTVMIKDENGNFVWFPDDVDIADNI